MNRASLIAICIALVCALWIPQAKADESNQATKVTFSQPVEIPGRVLPAGTYWFTVLSDEPEHNLVQVWDANRQHLITTLLTAPDYRLEPTGHTVINFEERPSNQPEALRAWFYPGDNFGHEFVYPEHQARELAKRSGRPVLSMRDEEESNMSQPIKSAKERAATAMKQTQIQAINPRGQEVDKSQAIQVLPSHSNQNSMHQH